MGRIKRGGVEGGVGVSEGGVVEERGKGVAMNGNEATRRVTRIFVSP